jgi:hypothetical protein
MRIKFNERTQKKVLSRKTGGKQAGDCIEDSYVRLVTAEVLSLWLLPGILPLL